MINALVVGRGINAIRPNIFIGRPFDIARVIGKIHDGNPIRIVAIQIDKIFHPICL